MALRKRQLVVADTSAHTLSLGASGGIVRRIDVLSSADTSVAVTVVDATSQTLLSLASDDWTTRYIEALDEVAVSPLTITATGLGSGNLTVDVWNEV